MDELEFLRALWPKARPDGTRSTSKRSDKLVVGRISEEAPGCFPHTDWWAFQVGLHFREALDIRYLERKVFGQSVNKWTQGPLLRFDVGDIVHRRDGRHLVQVTFAQPMGWDTAINEMYEGVVTFDEFDMAGESPSRLRSDTTTQMDFLHLLIYGHFPAGPGVPPRP
jgi:hypothetical protein